MGTSKNLYLVTILRNSQKYLLTYQLDAVSIFFVCALSCLEIRIFRGVLII